MEECRIKYSCEYHPSVSSALMSWENAALFWNIFPKGSQQRCPCMALWLERQAPMLTDKQSGPWLCFLMFVWECVYTHRKGYVKLELIDPKCDSDNTGPLLNMLSLQPGLWPHCAGSFPCLLEDIIKGAESFAGIKFQGCFISFSLFWNWQK